MTLYEFKLLPEDQQTQLVWDEGEFVADRYMNHHSVLLYQVHSFYVERYYFGTVNND